MDSNEEIRKVLDKLDEILASKRKSLEEQEAEAREARERLARYEGWAEPETDVHQRIIEGMYSTSEAAEIFGVTRETIRRRILKGDIYATRDEKGQYQIPAWAIQDAVGLEPEPEPEPKPIAESGKIPSGYLPVPEAAELVGQSAAWLYVALKDGKLPHKRFSSVTYKKTRLTKKYVHKDELERYARKNGLRYSDTK